MEQPGPFPGEAELTDLISGIIAFHGVFRPPGGPAASRGDNLAIEIAA